MNGLYLAEMDKIMFSIGKIHIRWYAFFIVVGAILAILMIIKEGRRFNISSDFLFNMCFWAIIFGIIGARLYYTVFNLDRINTLAKVIRIWDGGLAIHGGIILGLLVVVLYCKKYKVRLLRVLDLIAPALLLAQSIGRWGNFFNGEAHGGPTTLEHLQSLHIPQFIIDGMNIKGVLYEPTFLYESLWCLLGVIIILIIRRIKYTKTGQPAAIYLMWYGLGRFVIEMMRTDALKLGGFKVAQIVSVGMIIIGLVIIMITSRKGRYEDLYNQESEPEIRF